MSGFDSTRDCVGNWLHLKKRPSCLQMRTRKTFSRNPKSDCKEAQGYTEHILRVY